MDILIASFSKYNAVLSTCLNEFDKLNPNLNFRIITDSKLNFLPKKINCQITYLEKDQGWLKSILALLDDYDEDEQIILCMDDLLPKYFIGNEVLDAFIRLSKKEDFDSLKLYEPPSQRISSSIRSNFSEVRSCKNDRYPISTMFSIFKVSFLKEHLLNSSDAWDFEQNAITRIKNGSKCFSTPFNIIDFSNIVIKGSIVQKRLDENYLKTFVLKNMSKFDLILHYLTIIFSTIKSFSFRNFLRFLFH